MDASSTRVVILGKTGAGKSSLANTVFGEKLFGVNHSSLSETEVCQAETRSVNSRGFTLIDTPGFFDTNISEEDLKPEIIKCITESAPGVHAFLILLKVEKYTEHERAVITKIKETFGEEAFKYSTVVFTHGNQLLEGQKIEDFVCQNKSLTELIRKCGGRCHVIDNKYWNKQTMDENRSNKFQVEQLLQTIDKMIKGNKDGYYTNEMLQAVEEKIQRERERIIEQSTKMSEVEIDERAKNNIFSQLLIVVAGITTGTLIGAYFGVKILTKVVLKVINEAGKAVNLIKTLVDIVKTVELIAAGVAAVRAVAGGGAAGGGGAAAAEGGAAKLVFKGAVACYGVSAVVGALVGGYEGFKAAEKAETVWEAIEMATKTVTEGGKHICDKIDEFGEDSGKK